jgi:hypothetical protein
MYVCGPNKNMNGGCENINKSVRLIYTRRHKSVV